MDRMAVPAGEPDPQPGFGSNLGTLVRQVQSEVVAELEALSQEAMPHNLALRLRHVIDTYRSLEQTMELLLGERQRQWSRNASMPSHLAGVQPDGDGSGLDADRERLVRAPEPGAGAHHPVARARGPVEGLRAGDPGRFPRHLPFNFFYIAFAEEHGLSLFLYYLGDYSEETKRSAREMLSRQMLTGLNLPGDTLLEIDEFVIKVPEPDAELDGIRMITVAVPEHTPKLAGLLGVAYVGSNELTVQEESVVRSILSVMVMVVGSSKLLSRTMSELEYYAMHDP
jgi:hypothetical protein